MIFSFKFTRIQVLLLYSLLSICSTIVQSIQLKASFGHHKTIGLAIMDFYSLMENIMYIIIVAITRIRKFPYHQSSHDEWCQKCNSRGLEMGTIDCKPQQPLSSHSYTCHLFCHTTPHSQRLKDQVVSHFSQSGHPLTQFNNSIESNKAKKTNNTKASRIAEWD